MAAGVNLVALNSPASITVARKLVESPLSVQVLQPQGLRRKACSISSRREFTVQYRTAEHDVSTSASRASSVCKPVLDERHQELELPSSALAIAAAAASVSAAPCDFVTKICELKRLVSAPSREFHALCGEQISLCEGIVGSESTLSIFVRTAESYAAGQLEFFFAAGSQAALAHWSSESQTEVLLLFDRLESQGSSGLMESLLVKQKAIELPRLGALILPLVKDSFLVGLLVIERRTTKVSLRTVKPGKIKPVRPLWPPAEKVLRSGSTQRDGGSDILDRTDSKKPAIGAFTREQQAETSKIARILALACVMDQRAVLLQQSSWQKGVRIDNLLEQVREPLMTVRTLGKMLLPHLKRGEISRDVVEDILVQGDRMSDVVQQLQKSGADYIQFDDSYLKDPEGQTEWLIGKETRSSMRTLNSGKRNGAVQDLNKGIAAPALPMGVRDEESPMPPLALAPSPGDGLRQCNVLEILNQLVRAGSSLAEQKRQTLQVTSAPMPLIAAVEEVALRQALGSLLEYALQHTPEGGWIRADASRAPGGGVLVVIEDNGPDMGLVVQERVLGPLGSGLIGPSSGFRNNDKSFDAGVKLIAAREALEHSGAVLNIRSPFITNAPIGAGGTHVEVWLPS